jgi:hypothetical protein
MTISSDKCEVCVQKKTTNRFSVRDKISGWRQIITRLWIFKIHYFHR